MKLIALNKGLFAEVDDADFDWLNQFRWRAERNKRTGKTYATRHISPKIERHTIYMHREIMGLPKGDPRKIDHRKVEETLNNQRSNLRICSNSQNMMNGGKRSNNTTGFKGVSFHKRTKKYMAKIVVFYKAHHLGYYTSPAEAHLAYQKAAVELHGEFANKG